MTTRGSEAYVRRPTATGGCLPGQAGNRRKVGQRCRCTSSSATFAEQLDSELLDRDGIRLVNDDVGVRWLYSFLSADKKKTYCLYEAPNPEALREAAARLGIPADVIVEVTEVLEPT